LWPPWLVLAVPAIEASILSKKELNIENISKQIVRHSCPPNAAPVDQAKLVYSLIEYFVYQILDAIFYLVQRYFDEVDGKELGKTVSKIGFCQSTNS